MRLDIPPLLVYTSELSGHGDAQPMHLADSCPTLVAIHASFRGVLTMWERMFEQCRWLCFLTPAETAPMHSDSNVVAGSQSWVLGCCA